MININFNKLNPLEKTIHDTLLKSSGSIDSMTITQAAEICSCSVSKISKFVKKLGFDNYKQYMDFVYGKEIPVKRTSMELERLKNFIDDFDFSLIDQFIDLMNSCQKIILFGYGPSFICAEYFEYKLRINTNKVVIAVPDEVSMENMIDGSSLLVIFSTTGSFKSFDPIYELAKGKNSKVLFIIEEYNTAFFTKYDNVFWLSKYPQSSDLLPYDKSRSVFFIFIEEIIRQIIFKNRQEMQEGKASDTDKPEDRESS